MENPVKQLWKPGAVFTLDIEGKLRTALVDEKHHNPAAKYIPDSALGKRLLCSKVGDTFDIKIKHTEKHVKAIVTAVSGEKTSNEYVNHCWKCGASINSQKNQRCPKCKLFKCSKCGHCMCNSGIS